MVLYNLSKELTNLAVRSDNFVLLADFGNKNLNSFTNDFNLEN